MNFEVMDFVRSKKGDGLVLCINGDTAQVWTAERKRIAFRLVKLDVVSRGDVTCSELLAFHDADAAALQGVPAGLHAEIRRRWYNEVLKSGDGGAAQKRLSEFLGSNGIRAGSGRMQGDPCWYRVIDRGFELYNMK